MKRGRIIVVGSANTDLILRVANIPRPGETVLGGRFAIAPGGKGANQAVAVARAGGDVAFVARLGKDDQGQRLIDGLVRDRINVRHVVRDASHPSGVALICVSDRGENSIAVASGANGVLSPKDVQRARPVFVGARVLLVQLESPIAAITAAVRLAQQLGVQVIVNPAPARPLSNDLLKQVSVLTPNETEVERLTGVKVTTLVALRKASNRLHQRGVATILITLGARGVFVSTAGHQELLPAFRVRAVDTTAAGDVFSGALAVALAEGREIIVAVRFASAAAALSVTRLGAQPSIPHRSEIEKLLRTPPRG